MEHDEIITRLRRLDTCTLSDGLDKLFLPPAESGLVPRSVLGRICGRVITVRLEVGTQDPSEPRHLCTRAIECAQAGDVIVVEQRTGVDAAGWGGILSNAAKRAALSGVIVEGPARDIDEAREIGFPVYSRHATARTARGRICEVETGGPIRVGDSTVASGDYVVIDSSGAVFVSAEHVERLLKVAEDIASCEAEMTRSILAGAPVGAVMGQRYETMLSGS